MKLIHGQLEQVVEVSNKSPKNGFRLEGGKLVKYARCGRKRNHWKNHYRKISKKHLKDECENRRCSTIHYLTIHHKIPLSSAKSEEELIRLCKKNNCQTLCDKCHSELEHIIILKKNGKSKKKVKKAKLKIFYSREILIVEQGVWGEYRIIS